MNKRGQIAIFIIIGVVIFLAILSIFFIRNYVVEERITQVARPIAQELPSELEPIRVFTENCLKSVAEQALIRLGQHGGYLYPDFWDNLNFDEENPTDSDGLTFPGSELKIPYWWYNKISNDNSNVIFSSHRPSIRKMQDDLARFINLELATCLNEYKSFEPLDFEISEGTISAQVNIGPQNVNFLVRHPLDIKKGPTQAKLENFYVEIPVKLRHMYEIASVITEAQTNYSFLEQHTMNLIEIFSGVDENKLPPTTDDTFESSGPRWKKADVVEDLKFIFMAHIPFLRYYNSRNFYNYEFPEGTQRRELQQRVYNNMILPLEGAEDLDVRFQYLDVWEPYVNFNSEGEFIEPTSLTVDFWLEKFNWQRYNTVYDISYPVFVSLHSPDSLEGQGYTFNFALETNIRNNVAAVSDKFSGLISSYEESLFCNREQRNSGNITVRVMDAYTLLPLAGASVYMSDGEESCQMGTTDEHGFLVTQFPIVVGGVISANKEGHLSSINHLSTYLGEDDAIGLTLWKIKELEVNVFKKKIYNCKRKGSLEFCYFVAGRNATSSNPLEAALIKANNTENQAHIESISGSSKVDVSTWYFSNAPFDLNETEEVLINLKRISESEGEFIAGAYFSSFSTDNKIRLVPGNYTVMNYLIYNENYIIPAETRCPADDTCFTFNESNVSTLLLGGFVLQNKVWEIKPSDLYSAGKINFFVTSSDLPAIPESARIIEDVNQIALIENYTVKFFNDLKPVFT